MYLLNEEQIEALEALVEHLEKQIKTEEKKGENK